MSKRTQTKTPSASADSPKYFNEYVKGIGYLNGLRAFGAEGKPDRFSAQIAVIQGSADNVHYEYHDLIVASEAVLGVLLEHRAAIESEESRVLVRFNMVNPRAKAFLYKQGERAGELGATIGGLLTRILSMKVDGEVVYQDVPAGDESEEPRQVANG